MSNQGKGWGDGQKTAAYNQRRKRNPENTYTGFRPRVEHEAAYMVIRAWCDNPKINKSFSAIINSVMQGVKVAVENTTEIDPTTGEVSIELNLGRITIK